MTDLAHSELLRFIIDAAAVIVIYLCIRFWFIGEPKIGQDGKE